MDWNRFARREFWNYINNNPGINPNLVSALKADSSGRTSAFLRNLGEELSRSERLVQKRRGKPLKKETMKWAVHEMAKVLIRGIEQEAKRRVESDIEKRAREERLTYLDDLDKTTDGTPSGVFEELEIQDAYREEEDKEEEGWPSKPVQ